MIDHRFRGASSVASERGNRLRRWLKALAYLRSLAGGKPAIDKGGANFASESGNVPLRTTGLCLHGVSRNI